MHFGWISFLKSHLYEIKKQYVEETRFKAYANSVKNPMKFVIFSSLIAFLCNIPIPNSQAVFGLGQCEKVKKEIQALENKSKLGFGIILEDEED